MSTFHYMQAYGSIREKSKGVGKGFTPNKIINDPHFLGSLAQKASEIQADNSQ